MILSRLFGGLLFLLGLYYLGTFVVVRQEPFRVAQTTLLWGAALLLILQGRAASWLWRPATRRGWVLVGVGVLAAAALFVVVDGNSRSASDTIIGVLPGWSLLLAAAMSVIHQGREKSDA